MRYVEYGGLTGSWLDRTEAIIDIALGGFGKHYAGLEEMMLTEPGRMRKYLAVSSCQFMTVGCACQLKGYLRIM